MDLDEARAVVREQHRAVLATVRQDGTPQLSPVLVAVDDEGRGEDRVLVRVELTDAGPDRSG
ncbi:MAG: pyridoxamine 5'-phosphate oxidase family protein [Pseudonocardiaceae bacterium]